MQTTSRYASRTSASLGEGHSFIALRFGTYTGVSFPFTTHTARHTFATLITLEQGVPIETVSKMLGHMNVSMTERYAKVTPQKLFEEFNRFLSFTEDLRLTI